MKLSVVATLYRSSDTIDEFYSRALKAAMDITPDVEVVLVNDGSPDDSLDKAVTLHRADPRVMVVDLARNFGHHKAMMTGLAHARGDLVFLIDSDLEEEPEVLEGFMAKLERERCDVVYGVQDARRGRAFERVSGAAFFWLVDRLSDQPLPRNLVTARLMRRDYVRALVRHKDQEFLISQLWHTTGFRQVPIRIRKLSLSPTTYSVRRKLEIAVKHITTSSTKLLRLALYSGFSICLFSVSAIFYFIGRYLFAGVGVDGWTSLIVSVWLFGGITTLILGVLSIYIATILSESKRRPYTVVRQLYKSREPEAGGGRAVQGSSTEVHAHTVDAR